MGFVLSDEAREYFRELEKYSSMGGLDSVWDQYYLCLMVGLENRKLSSEEPSGEEFIDKFIDDYYEQRYEILGSLITAEIERKGIPWGEKERIRKEMLTLLDSSTSHNLTETGQEMMNRYAQGGFQILRENIPGVIDYGLDKFLTKYYDEFISE